MMNNQKTPYGHELNAQIGERLVELRKEDNIGQDTVAKVCKVSVAAVSNWENGKGMKVENLANVARLFGVRSDWLIFGKKPKR